MKFIEEVSHFVTVTMPDKCKSKKLLTQITSKEYFKIAYKANLILFFLFFPPSSTGIFSFLASTVSNKSHVFMCHTKSVISQ